jgi:hypothetical protein
MTSIGQPTQQASEQSCFDVLQGLDDLGAVIRAQFQIEARLQRVVESLTPHSRELPELRYEQKAHVAVALGLDARMLPAVQMLGHLRDNAVKYFDAGLSEAAVNQLFGLLAREDREAVLNLHRERLGDDAAYQQAPALQRFIAIAAIVDQFLVAAVVEARGMAEISPEQHLDADSEDHPEVITFEWSAPPPRRAHDFATSEALYSYLTARDRS